MQLEKELSPETIKILWRLYRQSKNYQVRTRAHCILLMNSKYKLEELITIFGASRKTIDNWRNNWSKNKLAGLYKRWKYMATPTYSPQLNIIEILWRFMKYEWLETKAYNCWKTLTQYVEHILRHFGDRFGAIAI